MLLCTECFTYASWAQNDTMASKSVMADLSVSFAHPRFSCTQVHKMCTNSRVSYELWAPYYCANLSAGHLLPDEEVQLLLVSRGVVRATGGGKPVPPSSPRLLVVTRQRLGEIPVSYKPAGSMEAWERANPNPVADAWKPHGLTWRSPCRLPSRSWWWLRWPAPSLASTHSGPLCDLLLSGLRERKQWKKLSPLRPNISNSSTLSNQSNLHGTVWPRLRAWSAGEPLFHSLPWSDSTQSHSPVDPHHMQCVKETAALIVRPKWKRSANNGVIAAYMTGSVAIWG